MFENYERNHVLKRIYQQGSDRLIWGAGRETVSKFFLEQGYEVHALEWTKSGVQRLNELGIKTVQQDIEKLPYEYEDNFFDEIFWGTTSSI